MVAERREGEGAGADPSQGSGILGEVPPWPANFPDVIVHATLEQLYGAALATGESLGPTGQSQAYARAKAGDALAARQVILSIIRPQLILDFASKLPDAVIVGVHAQERAGRNALPEAFVEAIEQIGLLTSDLTIVQTNRTWHTGATARQRLARTPTFAGVVEPGRDYVVVDDVITTGSSLCALRHFIEGWGGRVRLATTLAAAKARWGQNPLKLAISTETARALEQKFDRQKLDAILTAYGTAPTIYHVTEAQGKTVLGFESLDALRSSLTSSRQAADSP